MLEKKLSEIDHALEVDEEGYPVFSGLRIHDEPVLSDIFQNIRRTLPNSPGAKIVTCMEGEKWAWLDAFDAPLVVQTVDHLDGLQFLIHFLGGLSFSINFEDLSEDEWGRLHCYVGDTFPAVFSRKAQAALLNTVAKLPEKPPKLSFHREAVERNSKTPSESEFWSESYDEGGAWELGQAHPKLREELSAGLVSKTLGLTDASVIYVPGAGRGQDAMALAEYVRVNALDFAPEAKQEFEELHSKKENFPRVQYEQKDVFECFSKLEDGSVDAVFEHTFFCAIDPCRRKEYVQEVLRVLKPKTGKWFGVFFLLENPEGPPFALTQWELREFVQNTFDSKMDILAWERIAQSPQQRLHKELWAVMSRS